jgi:5-formyltetrahydrofolate cyclo-ligase
MAGMPSAHLPDPRKTELRRTLRAARREHAPAADRATEGAAIARAVLALLEVAPPPGTTPGGAWCVAAYESLPTEPPTEGLIAALLDHGVRVLVPVLEADLDLDWRPAEHPEHRTGASAPPRAGAAQLRTGSELGHDAIGTAQVVVVPALAVDRGGVRLGQGGGSYDRALARRSPGALVVAVVHDEELVDGPLPHEPHDQPVDAVVTSGLGLVRLPTIPR